MQDSESAGHEGKLGLWGLGIKMLIAYDQHWLLSAYGFRDDRTAENPQKTFASKEMKSNFDTYP